MNKNNKQENFQKLIPKINQKFSNLQEENQIPGVGFAFFDKEQLITENYHGHLNLDKRQPVDEDTLFCLQSTTKTVTALTVILSVQKGYVDLDTPIISYLSEFKMKSQHGQDEYKKITLRNLLSHSAGLFMEGRVGGVFNNDPCTWQEHVTSIFNSWLKFPVGKIVAYSNIGMDLAAYVCERASGKKYPDLVKELLCEPLGIKILFTRKEVEKTKNHVFGYYSDFPASPTDNVGYGCGIAYMTVGDIVKLNQFLLNRGKVGGKQLLNENYVNELCKPKVDRKYGLGTFIDNIEGWGIFNHAGGGFGYTSEFYWQPELNIGLVALGNNEDAAWSIKTVCRDILRDYIQITNQTKDPQEFPDEAEEPLVDELDLDTFTGFYHGVWGSVLIAVENDNLVFNYGRESMPIRRVSERKFETDDNLPMKFELDSSKNPTKLLRMTGSLGLLEYNFADRQNVIMKDNGDHLLDKVGLYSYPLYDSDILYELIRVEGGNLVLYSDHRRVLNQTEDPSKFALPDGGVIEFGDGYMYNSNGTKSRKDSEVVKRTLELAQKNPRHRHLTNWMLYNLSSSLEFLDRHNEASQIKNIISEE